MLFSSVSCSLFFTSLLFGISLSFWLESFESPGASFVSGWSIGSVRRQASFVLSQQDLSDWRAEKKRQRKCCWECSGHRDRHRRWACEEWVEDGLVFGWGRSHDWWREEQWGGGKRRRDGKEEEDRQGQGQGWQEETEQFGTGIQGQNWEETVTCIGCCQNGTSCVVSLELLSSFICVCRFVSLFFFLSNWLLCFASGECSQPPQRSGRNAQLWRRPARPQSIGTRLGPQHDRGCWRSGQSESEHQSILELRQIGHGGLHSGREPNDLCAIWETWNCGELNEWMNGEKRSWSDCRLWMGLWCGNRCSSITIAWWTSRRRRPSWRDSRASSPTPSFPHSQASKSHADTNDSTGSTNSYLPSTSWLVPVLADRMMHVLQVPIPPLPEKQMSGRYEEDLIDHRKHILQLWVNKICRHPVLSQSEVSEWDEERRNNNRSDVAALHQLHRRERMEEWQEEGREGRVCRGQLLPLPHNPPTKTGSAECVGFLQFILYHY